MGQQQLLLVILVTIIVGIATVVAVETFGSAAKNANVSAVRNDIAQIASDAQAQYRKPKVLGGANQSWANISFGKMAFAYTHENGLNAINQNGSYTLTVGSKGDLVITAYPSNTDAYNGSLNADGSGTTTYATTGKKLVYEVSKNKFAEKADSYCGTCQGIVSSGGGSGSGS